MLATLTMAARPVVATARPMTFRAPTAARMRLVPVASRRTKVMMMASAASASAAGAFSTTTTPSTSSSSSPSSSSSSSTPSSTPILALALALVSSFKNKIATVLKNAEERGRQRRQQQQKQRQQQQLSQAKKHAADELVKQHVRSMKTLAAVAPLAVTTGGEHVFLLLTRSVASFIKLYLLFLFMRVLLSWFPAFNWDRQPWLALRQLTDPYLNMFRGFIPPFFGMIDFTPLLGFFVLQWVQSLLEAATMDEDDIGF